MHKPRKRFGQNFLHDTAIIQQIVRSIAVTPKDHLVEIGPGQGAITEALLAYSPACLHAIEIDRDLVAQLTEHLGHHRRFVIHYADILQVNLAQQVNHTVPLRVVGNLPYNISTPLLLMLLQQLPSIMDMHFMLQKEVVQRLCAQPGSKDYGRLSILAQYHCQCDYLFTVPPEAFFPAPKVDSAIVRLIPHCQQGAPPETVDLQQFAALVKQAFSQRRKTLSNNLKNWLSVQQLEQLGINPRLRPEALTLSQYVRLTQLYCQTQRNPLLK